MRHIIKHNENSLSEIKSRISTHCTIKVKIRQKDRRQNCMVIAFLDVNEFERVITFLFSVFGIRRKHGMTPVEVCALYVFKHFSLEITTATLSVCVCVK